jgi:hypothetical protein
MAIINGFNVGTDASLVISDQYGDLFPAESLGHLIDFESETIDHELEVIPITLGGVPIFQTIWAGAQGKMSFARYNGGLTNMILALSQAYFTQGIIPQFSITLNILNRDGSIDEYLFQGVQWNRPRFGNFRAQKEVDQSIDFKASQMIVMGGATSFLANLPAVA